MAHPGHGGKRPGPPRCTSTVHTLPHPVIVSVSTIRSTAFHSLCWCRPVPGRYTLVHLGISAVAFVPYGHVLLYEARSSSPSSPSSPSCSRALSTCSASPIASYRRGTSENSASVCVQKEEEAGSCSTPGRSGRRHRGWPLALSASHPPAELSPRPVSALY